MNIVPRKPYRILTGDVREMLRTMPDESVHCVVTSPPYWGLRDYGTEPQVWGGDPACEHEWGNAILISGGAQKQGATSQRDGRANVPAQEKKTEAGAYCSLCRAWRGSLGLEHTIELYVEHIVEVFREVRRVLRKNGTLWLNMGDCYAGSWGAQSRSGNEDGLSAEQIQAHPKGQTCTGSLARTPGLKPKDLVGQPWRLAFALQGFAILPGAVLNNAADLLADAREAKDWESVRGVEGMLRAWARASAFLDPCWLRSDIIWAKPNPMPESCTDRPTKSHEYVFMLTKAAKYFFDQEAVREAATYAGKVVTLGPKSLSRGQATGMGVKPSGNANAASVTVGSGRNIRSVWTIPTQAFPEAHFATFPEALPERCIKAGTSERGCCPECGAPWVRVVEKHPTGTKQKMPDGYDTGLGAHGSVHRNGREKGEAGHDIMRSTTIGWQPSCEHKSEPIPCTVLDPFVGSGTTALVAVRLGRRAIGIDLSAKYTDMVEKQLAVAARGDSRRPRKFRLKGRKKMRRRIE